MKKLNYCFMIVAMVVSTCFLQCMTSCSNEKEISYIGVAVMEERYPICMAVTNNMNEDLIAASNDYVTDGPASFIHLYKWNVYWGQDNIRPCYDEDYERATLPVLHNSTLQHSFIYLSPFDTLLRKMRVCEKEQHLEYRLTSLSLFGDEEEHIIHLDIQKAKKSSFSKFTVSVDGVEQKVYYPDSPEWKGFTPKVSSDVVGNIPYFVLNVDK